MSETLKVGDICYYERLDPRACSVYIVLNIKLLFDNVLLTLLELSNFYIHTNSSVYLKKLDKNDEYDLF